MLNNRRFTLKGGVIVMLVSLSQAIVLVKLSGIVSSDSPHRIYSGFHKTERTAHIKHLCLFFALPHAFLNEN